MTLPVSSYEALLVQVRELTHETILLQRQLSSELYQNVDSTDVNHNLTHFQKNYEQERFNVATFQQQAEPSIIELVQWTFESAAVGEQTRECDVIDVPDRKLVVDNVIRRCDRKIEIGQRTLIDRNEFAFHPRLTPSLDRPRENFNSSELTARLIAWRDQDHQRRPSYEEETTYRREKHSGTYQTDGKTGIPSLGRVGVEGIGSPSLLSWESSATAAAAATAATRETTVARPYYAAGDPPLSARERTTAEQLQSALKLSLPPQTTLIPRSSEQRCPVTRTSYRTHELRSKGHDMEPDGKDDNEANSGTPSPELYARTSKCYDEDGSSEEESKQDDSSQAHRLSSLYHGTWPVKRDLWTSQQMSFPGSQASSAATQHNDMASVMSFSSSTCMSSCSAGMQGHRRLGAKVDVVYSLLGMLGSTEGREDMSSTLLAMSNSIDSCLVMRQSGCLPLLVQLIHAPGQDAETRERAARALHNVIHARSDEKVGRREARVLRLLEQVRDYCQALRASLETERPPDDLERHPGPTIAALMKLSFDEAHRHAMCQLGGLHAVAELIEMDHAAHGSESDDQSCVTLRRYAGMALTNLTFGDGNNKALLCSFRAFMRALVSQLRSLSDDLRQVTASVLRNLSWRADSSSKQTLREVGAVTGLMKAAMEGRKESTLKSILSALWNLSAHCSTNKVDICAVEGALAFLVDMLSYKAPSKTLSIVENAGGILRNVSSHIAVREDYRSIVRERDCLQVLLRQLRSPSLTVVSNACGALWNLSARCPHDQRLLWDLGAVPMLRSLVHSKHKMISMGSSAALKNLLSARPAGSNLVHLDSTARGLGLSTLPTLVARRQRALEQEIDQNLAETCDNIEPSTSPTNKDDKFPFKVDQSFVDIAASRGRSYQLHGNQSGPSSSKYNGGVPRSDSRESMRSVTSTHSDTIFERVNRHINNGLTPTELQIKQQSSSLHSAVGFTVQPAVDGHNKTNQLEKKYALRYKNSIPERLRPTDLAVNEIGDLRCTASTMSWATAPDQESACSQILMHSSVEDGLSPMTTSKLSGRSSAEGNFSKRTDNSVALSSQVNYKSPLARSPIGNSSFSPAGLVEPIVKCEIAKEQPIHSPTLSHTSESDPFEVYAETDIDRPTNYSLRYAERNSDEDDKQSSGYFAGSEQETEDTVKTYYTEGTPYETPLNSSGAASDNDLPDASRIRPLSQNIHLGRITDVARDIRRESFPQKNTVAVESDVTSKNLEISPPSLDVNLSALPNSLELDSDVTKSSESLADSGLAVAERSQTSEFETVKLSLDVDSASSIDAVVPRLNSLVLNDEPKIINDSRHKELDVRESREQSVRLDAENFPETMISDGDDDDEDLLAACIHIGMQNNRHRQSFRRNSLEKTPPEESNLARYQTSTALDQVEDTGFPEQTDRPLQSEAQRFNIKMPSELADDYCQPDSMENGYPSFEDNFNVAQDDDKITVEYQKLQEYSCDQEESPTDFIDGNVSAKRQKSVETNRETRANSVEDNLLAQDECLVVESTNAQSDSTPEARDSESMESFDSVERSERALLQLCIKTGASKAETILMSESNSPSAGVSIAEGAISHITENSTHSRVTVTRQDCEETEETAISRIKKCQARHVEDEYKRQRDPDAMIASLDRLTATLVQQTEAMRERESSAMKQSVMSDTWNEDSPNDVSYPSISVSAPLIASFKSDIDEEHTPVAPMPTLREGENGVEPSSMTNSRIIEREAIRLAEAVSAEGSRQLQQHNSADFGASSLTSNDLEAIKPPSTMNSLISLTASYVGPFDSYDTSIGQDRCHSTSISPVRAKNPLDPRNGRKKSLPVGVMAKRALAHSVNHTGSLESLLNDCSIGTNSQLENVKPPSMMDELFDSGDMENSMLSVASITSETADFKDQDSNSLTGSDPVFDLLKPVANVLSITCMRYAQSMQTSANDSISEYLENINPPSLFNEVSEMDDSTMEANTDTLCSDTLCIDAELRTEEAAPHPMIVDRIEEVDNDTDEAGTPIHTESCFSSSAESTPKKRLNKNHLTPKQKRQLAKERYKTYTIAAELVKKEEEERRKQEQLAAAAEAAEMNKVPRGKCSPFSKLTPKQRRQEDRARFQTQVLENPLPDLTARVNGVAEEIPVETPVIPEELPSPAKSSIPTLANLCGGRTFRKKRVDGQESKDRYRTRTLNDEEETPGESSTNNGSSEAMRDIGSEAIQSMLEQNANIVLHTLNETSKVGDSIGEESMLDCETLSLVSNDSESEHSLRMRLASGLGKKLMTSYVQKASQQALCQRQEELLVVENGVCEPGERVQTEETPEISESESEEESRQAEELPQEPKRPRITKPGATSSRDRSVDSNGPDKSEPGSPKAIRGRRKALYSTPNTRKATPQSSPLKQVPTSGIPIGRSNTSPVVRATRATTLRQNTNTSANAAKDARSSVGQKSPQAVNAEKRARSAALAKRSSIPQRGSSIAAVTKSVKRHSTPPGCQAPAQKDTKPEIPQPKPLERQGTFTKDEPEVENVPTVVVCSSPSKSKIAKPTKGSPIRVNPVAAAAGKSKISVRSYQNPQQQQPSKMTKCSSAEKIQSPRVSPSLGAGKRTATVESAIPSRADHASAQTEIGRMPRRAVSLGQRSNSNSSIVSTSAAAPTARKLPKEATSKIASLWKKVEESKSKQKYEKPDTRQWITAASDAAADSEAIAVTSKPPTFRLFRSSTFEGVPQEAEDTVPTKIAQRPARIFEANPTKYRNSCDLTGMTSADAPCKIPVKHSDSRTNSKETPIGYGTIVLRKQRSDDSSAATEIDGAKRISRLGSFIRVDAAEAEGSLIRTGEAAARTPVSAIVPPFHYSPRQVAPTPATRTRLDEDEVYDCQTEIVTGSTRVTTV